MEVSYTISAARLTQNSASANIVVIILHKEKVLRRAYIKHPYNH